MWEKGWEDSFSTNIGLLLSLPTIAGVVYLGLRQALRRVLSPSGRTHFERVGTASHDAKGVGI